MPLPSSAVTNQHSKNNNFHIILSRKHLFIFTFSIQYTAVNFTLSASKRPINFTFSPY